MKRSGFELFALCLKSPSLISKSFTTSACRTRNARNRWKLIEKLAADIADAILAGFKPASVTVEVKKFVIPQARHVSVVIAKKLQPLT